MYQRIHEGHSPARVIRAAVAFSACLSLQLGCGRSADKPALEGLAEVTGAVTLDDQPLEGATVLFVPLAPETSKAFDAGAVTDENGVFALRAGEGQEIGAPPGNYRVVISRLVLPDGSPAALDAEKSPMQLALEGAKETLHAAYSDLAFSKLTATVPPGGGNLDFKLSTRGM